MIDDVDDYAPVPTPLRRAAGQVRRLCALPWAAVTQRRALAERGVAEAEGPAHAHALKVRRALVVARSERDILRGIVDRMSTEVDELRAVIAANDRARASNLETQDAKSRHETEGALAALSADVKATRADLAALRDALPLGQHEATSDLADTAECAATIAETHRIVQRLVRNLEHTDRRVQYLHHELLSDIQALIQLTTRYKPEARLPPVGGWALTSGGLLALADLVESRGATTIVECGSGTSTLWIAYALRRLGRGRVIAFDHLPEYAERTRELVDAHGLSSFVDVRLAPLVPQQTPRGEFLWYDINRFDRLSDIDVLLVDGPPQATGRHARYPALPALLDSLSEDAIVMIDDADRRDEREMIELWFGESAGFRRLASPARGVEIFERVSAP